MIEEFAHVHNMRAFGYRYQTLSEALKHEPWWFNPYNPKNVYDVEWGIARLRAMGMSNTVQFTVPGFAEAVKKLRHIHADLKAHRFGPCTGFFHLVPFHMRPEPEIVFAFEREVDALWLKMLWPHEVSA